MQLSNQESPGNNCGRGALLRGGLRAWSGLLAGSFQPRPRRGSSRSAEGLRGWTSSVVVASARRSPREGVGRWKAGRGLREPRNGEWAGRVAGDPDGELGMRSWSAPAEADSASPRSLRSVRSGPEWPGQRSAPAQRGARRQPHPASLPLTAPPPPIAGGPREGPSGPM